MSPEDAQRRGFLLLFIATWLFLYTLFPQWSLPVSSGLKGGIFAAYLVYFAANGLLLWFLLKKESFSEPQGEREAGFFIRLRGNRSLLLLLGLAFVLHLIFALTLPENFYGTDEEYHLYTSTMIVHKFDTLLARARPFSFVWALRGVVLVVALAAFLGLRRGWPSFQNRVLRLVSLPGGIGAGLLVVGSFLLILLSGIPVPSDLFEYPPMGKLLYLGSFAFFQVNVVSARLVQIGFALASGVVVYELTRLYRDGQTGTLAAGIFLFSPAVFFFGHMADLESGVVFFLLLTAYWFLRHEKSGQTRDLLWAMYFVGLGYNYKPVVVYVFFVFWAFWLLTRLRSLSPESLRGLLRLISYSWVGVVPILPGLLQNVNFSSRLFGWVPARFGSFTDTTTYFQSLPSEVTFGVFVLFLGGVAWGLWRQLDAWTGYLLLWFIFFYGIFTSWIYFPDVRFLAYFVPPVAMLAAPVFRELLKRLKYPLVAAGLVVALLAHLVYSSAFVGFPPPGRTIDRQKVPEAERQLTREAGERRLRRLDRWRPKGQ